MEPVYLYTKVPKDINSKPTLKAATITAKKQLLLMMSASHPHVETVWFRKELASGIYGKWRVTERKECMLIEHYPFEGENKADRVAFVLCKERHPRDNPLQSRSRYRRAQVQSKLILTLVRYSPFISGRYPLIVEEMTSV